MRKGAGVTPHPFLIYTSIISISPYPHGQLFQLYFRRQYIDLAGKSSKQGLDRPSVRSLCDGFSFAPLGLAQFPLAPTACVVGCILTPLRGWEQAGYSTYSDYSDTITL